MISERPYIAYYPMNIHDPGVQAEFVRKQELSLRFSLPANLRVLAAIPGKDHPMLVVADNGVQSTTGTAYELRVCFATNRNEVPAMTGFQWTHIGCFQVQGTWFGIHIRKVAS